MNRDLVINVLLIVAGIVLAFLLFGAGAVWRGKSLPKILTRSHPHKSSQSEEGALFETNICRSQW
jgi:hypothetical protein